MTQEVLEELERLTDRQVRRVLDRRLKSLEILEAML